MQLLSTIQTSSKQSVVPAPHSSSYIELVEQAIVDYSQAMKSSQATVRESFSVSLGLAKELLKELHVAEEISEERQNHRKPHQWRTVGVAKRAELSQSIFSKRLTNAEKIRDLRNRLLDEQDRRSTIRNATKH